MNIPPKKQVNQILPITWGGIGKRRKCNEGQQRITEEDTPLQCRTHCTNGEKDNKCERKRRNSTVPHASYDPRNNDKSTVVKKDPNCRTSQEAAHQPGSTELVTQQTISAIWCLEPGAKEAGHINRHVHEAWGVASTYCQSADIQQRVWGWPPSIWQRDWGSVSPICSWITM